MYKINFIAVCLVFGMLFNNISIAGKRGKSARAKSKVNTKRKIISTKIMTVELVAEKHEP